jgi:hypothetical protein
MTTAFSLIDMNDAMCVKRWHESAEKSIPSSPILGHYQAHMRGVDVADQLRGYHMVQNKDHKWWHCLFMHTLDMSLVTHGSCIEVIYKRRVKKKLSH